MKKLLLLAALAATTLGASAQEFSEMYKVTAHGKEVKDGETVTFTERDDLGTYEAIIRVTAIDGTERNINASFSVTGQPSTTDIATGKWGTIEFCYETSEGGGNCLPPSNTNPRILGMGSVTVPGDGWMQWNIHDLFVEVNEPSVYKLAMSPVEDGNEMDAYFECNVRFAPADSAVETVEIDENLPVEYYDLAGRRVENPAKGIYILRQGDKAVKRVVR